MRKLSSRKLWVGVGSLLMIQLNLMAGLISEDAFQVLLMFVLGSYLATQGAVDVTEKVRAK